METNDIFDELSDINKLLRQTVFADKCLQLLEKYRQYMIIFWSNCRCDQTLKNQTIIKDLEIEYKSIVNEKQTKSCEDLNNSHNNDNINNNIDLIDSSDNDINDININPEELVNFSLNIDINSPLKLLEKNKSIVKKLIPNKPKLIANKPQRNYRNIKKIKIEVLDNKNVNKDDKNEFIFGNTLIAKKKIEFKLQTERQTESNINEVLTEEEIAKPFTCHICGKCFRKLHHLNAHLQKVIHVNPSERPFKCEHCSKSFKSTNNLREHKNNMHSTKHYKCGQCDKIFKNLQNFRNHLKTAHTDSKHKCDWNDCHFQTTSIYVLQNHKMRHNNDRPYPCDWPECGHRCVSKNDLKQHNRTHIRDKPCSCDWPECEEAFGDKRDLTNHINKVHKNCRPFKCPNCDASFSGTKALSHHKFKCKKETSNV